MRLEGTGRDIASSSHDVFFNRALVPSILPDSAVSAVQTCAHLPTLQPSSISSPRLAALQRNGNHVEHPGPQPMP